MALEFTVFGKPQPQGSSRAFVTRGGRAVVTSDNPNLKDWRQQVGMAAQAAPGYAGALIEGPVRVSAAFHLSRPKSRPKREQQPDRKPDLDKLARALLDGITGVVIRDDAQVCRLEVTKLYADYETAPRADIRVEAMQ